MGRLGFALGVAVSLLVVGASPASGAGTPAGPQKTTVAGNFAYVERPYELEVGTQNYLRAVCPGGMHVISGGVDLAAAEGDGNQSASLPIDTKRDRGKLRDDGWGVFVDVFNADIFLGYLPGTVHATCTRFRPRYPSERFTLGSDRGRSLRPACPAGMRAAGGGAWHVEPFDIAYLSVTRPGDGPDREEGPGDAWTSVIYNDGNRPTNGRAWATCLRLPLTYRREVSENQGGGVWSTDCGDARLIGGGVSHTGRPAEVRIDSSFPFREGDPASAHEWFGGIDEYSERDVFVRSHAVCLGRQ